MSASPEIRNAFISEAVWHGSLEKAESILAAHPEIATADIYTAAILGDHKTAHYFLQQDADHAISVSEPFDATALVYLSLSKYLRLQKRASEDFLKTASLLLDAGADANSGFMTKGAHPEFETALYGAAGVAQHAGLTALLLQHGADPNDEEAVYHSPETWDNDAMKLLVETGKLTAESLVLMLLRKHDWHDEEGARFLLEHGADPNKEWKNGLYPLHHALGRSNGPGMFRLLLDHGADPCITARGLTAFARAAYEGRADVLQMMREYKPPCKLENVDQLIAACAENDTAAIHQLVEEKPELVNKIKTLGGILLSRFAGNGNADGITQLLALGIDVNAPFEHGDAYFGTPKNSLAIHVAAWHGYPGIVKILIAHGAHADQPDENGNTPLALAVRACINSYWMARRSPESVRVLLAAGASPESIPFPSGYDAVDELLSKHRSSNPGK